MNGSGETLQVVGSPRIPDDWCLSENPEFPQKHAELPCNMELLCPTAPIERRAIEQLRVAGQTPHMKGNSAISAFCSELPAAPHASKKWPNIRKPAITPHKETIGKKHFVFGSGHVAGKPAKSKAVRSGPNLVKFRPDLVEIAAPNVG